MMQFPQRAGTQEQPVYTRDAGAAVLSSLISGAKAVQLYGSMTLASALTRSFWANGNTENQTIATSAVGLEILSSSASDAAAGTGARTVVVEGLTAAFVEQSETVTLNGVTSVALVNTYMRINNAYVATTGSGLTNAGTITIRATADTPVYAVISIGVGRLNQLQYTVPASHTALVTHLSFGSMADSDETAIPLESCILNARVGYTGASASALVYRLEAALSAYRGAHASLVNAAGLFVLPAKSLFLPTVANACGNAEVIGNALILDFTNDT